MTKTSAKIKQVNTLFNNFAYLFFRPIFKNIFSGLLKLFVWLFQNYLQPFGHVRSVCFLFMLTGQ